MDEQKVRSDFPILSSKTQSGAPLIYLDSAATAQKPRQVIEAISDFYTHSYGTVHRAVYDLATRSTEKFQEAREKIRAFLNAAKLEEVIFTRGTTESINLVAFSFGERFVSEGNEILISAMEHHSNLVPWQMLCERKKAILKVIPITEKGEIDLAAYEALLSSKTRLVAVTHLSNVLGSVNPVQKMIEMAHKKGAKVLIDGAQSAPHMKIDVQALDADFFVFSGHKLFGPTGIGVLYGKEELLNAMPPYQGGGDMIEKVSFEKTTYNTLPLKFEAGTPMIAEVIGLGAAVDYLNSFGMEEIEKRETLLFQYALEKMSNLPFVHIIGRPLDRKSVISFTVGNMHPLDVGTLLDVKGIAVRTGHHCAQPLLELFGYNSVIRMSIAFYNTKQEIDTFVAALEKITKL